MQIHMSIIDCKEFYDTKKKDLLPPKTQKGSK